MASLSLPRLLVVLSVLAVNPVQALEIAGVRLASASTVGGQALALRGAELLRWKWLVKIYVAALYLPPELRAAEALGEVPRRLEFHYRHELTAAQLVEATNRTITKGRSGPAVAAIAAEVKAFNTFYPAVAKGDVMAIDYEPSVGTTMRVNGIVRGTVPGADFARALFAIWIGDHAVDGNLKAALLGHP